MRRLTAQLSRATMSVDKQSSSLSSAASGDAATAAILIIGDEILKVRVFFFLIDIFALCSFQRQNEWQNLTF